MQSAAFPKPLFTLNPFERNEIVNLQVVGLRDIRRMHKHERTDRRKPAVGEAAAGLQRCRAGQSGPRSEEGLSHAPVLLLFEEEGPIA
jgi:hypothetical protein